MCQYVAMSCAKNNQVSHSISIARIAQRPVPAPLRSSASSVALVCVDESLPFGGDNVETLPMAMDTDLMEKFNQTVAAVGDLKEEPGKPVPGTMN